MFDPEVQRRLKSATNLIPSGVPSVSRWAVYLEEELNRAGLAVRVKDDDGKLADQVKDLIFERTQLVDGDAYDLAWDVLNLLQGESNA